MNYPLNKILLPMGAVSVKDEKKLEALWDDPNYVAEEKLDGSRYLSIGGRFFSRRISDVTGFPVEKTAQVPHLAEVLQKYPLLILDGEIYYEGKTSNEVTSILGSLPERAIELQKQRGKLKYVLFDILRDEEGNWLIDLPYKERRNILEDTFNRLIKDTTPYIELTTVCYGNKKEFYESIIRRGGEGAILKNINGKYVPDKRPAWNWIKVKKNITDDVVIIGFKLPVKEYTGKELDSWPYWEKDGVKYLDRETFEYKQRSAIAPPGVEPANDFLLEKGYTPVTKFYFYGWIGSVIFGKYDKDGNLVELGECSGLTDELREDMSKHPEKYLGKVMEIGAMEITKDGHYRHPVFKRMRDDKNPKDCVVGVM